MKKKHLLSMVQPIKSFSNPNVELEQYMTPADIATDIVYHADVEDKIVVDLGCGTGMLSICSIILDAKHVYAVDIDRNALDMLKVNVEEILGDTEDLLTLIESSISELSDISGDICIANPPFGTRNAGIDKQFIKKGIELCPTMYSLHKSSTREHLVNYCESLNATCKVLAEIRYDVQNSYKFHKSKSKDIEVDLLLIQRK